jgi:hypothetical protein
VKDTIAIASDFAEANVHADAPRQVTHRPATGVALGLGETTDPRAPQPLQESRGGSRFSSEPFIVANLERSV